MRTPRLGLRQFISNGGEWFDAEKCIHVNNPHLLTQISGYAKYVLGGDGRLVHYRGQPISYPTLKASLHRVNGHHKVATIYDRRKLLKEYIDNVRTNSAMLRGTPDHVHEPLLQHYGLRTNWIDIVDNIWIALWFACHKSITSGKHDSFVSFQKRSFADAKTAFAYIVIVAFDAPTAIKDKPGTFRNKEYEIADLRIAVPSVYVRPHAQHGLVFRKRTIDTVPATDCSSAVFGTIRISLADAFKWLGDGDLLSVQTLFPSPYYDHGYRHLLENAPEGHPFLGSVSYIGA